MGRRLLVSALMLVFGSGIGFAACWFTRPVPVPPATDPPAGDEVVVEVRVKLPPGAVRANEPHHAASSVRQGALLSTGEPFDLAIQGVGFFQLTLPNGETAYTRDGGFGTNAQGSIVTRQGHLLVPQIIVPLEALEVSVGSDGTVTMRNRTGQVSTLGQLTLARFLNPGWLDRDADGLWRETVGSGPPHVGRPGTHTFGLICQGFRERQAALDSTLLVDLVRAIVREGGDARVRVER